MPNYSGGMSICPFYTREAQYTIFCAYDPCDIQDVGSVALKFRSVEGKAAHQRKRCLSYNYPRCPIARAYFAEYAGGMGSGGRGMIGAQEREGGCH